MHRTSNIDCTGTERAPGQRARASRLPRLVEELAAGSLVLPEALQRLPDEIQQQLVCCQDREALVAALVNHRLLTDYQASRILSGTMHGLVLGNYRVLDRLGAGAMGVVFKAEHRYLRRVAAVKVLPVHPGGQGLLLDRFYSEMQAVAQLQHPNIVAAFDAGLTPGPDPDAPVLHYFVMEYVPGENLEEHVDRHGPLPVVKACDLIHQVASALVEAHKHNLVHRDIKPSNVLVTPNEQAKLLDFGLARLFSRRHTQPGTVLGTLDYMAPEQARDASLVDIRADIYALGGTLYYCLTSQPPFPAEGNLAQELLRRLTSQPPSVRGCRPEVPAGLDQVIVQMMATQPEDRYATPEQVLRALLPFLKPEQREDRLFAPLAATLEVAPPADNAREGHRILIVDDEPGVRGCCRFALEGEGLVLDEAEDGLAALAALALRRYDLVLLDLHMPNLTGLEVLHRIRKGPCPGNLKIIMFSGRGTADEMSRMLLAGADGYLTKPFSVVQLESEVKAALRLKDAQDGRDLLNQRLLTINAELERSLAERNGDLVRTRNALILALAKLAQYRDNPTSKHALRLQRYSRLLAESARADARFAGQLDAGFIDMLSCCAALHDIGKVGLPDYILLKPGKLTPDERMLMQTHTQIGADILMEVGRQHGDTLGFLQMAIDVCRHHHERFDGSGYPDKLKGSAIPLAASIVTICDVYDALRSRRVHKPALAHGASLRVLTEGSPGEFDPAVLAAFQRCASEFDRIFQEWPD